MGKARHHCVMCHHSCPWEKAYFLSGGSRCCVIKAFQLPALQNERRRLPRPSSEGLAMTVNERFFAALRMTEGEGLRMILRQAQDERGNKVKYKMPKAKSTSKKSKMDILRRAQNERM
jgi:hypothetical protein